MVTDFIYPKIQDKLVLSVYVLQIGHQHCAFCLRVFYLWHFQSEE